MTMTDPIRTLEDMTLPCPHDICDGTGIIMGEEGEEKCLCRTDEELKEQY